MNPFLTNSQAQYSQGQPLSPIGGPVFVDSERLLIEYKLAPPLDLRGYYHDGIEFYSCIRKDCKSVWAAQWNPTPRNRKISGTVTMATYKSLSVPKSCDKCKRTITASDKERQKKYEAYKVRIEEHTVMAARQKREREFAHDLVGIWQGSQTPTVPMAAASVTGTSKGDYNSVPAVTVDRQAEHRSKLSGPAPKGTRQQAGRCFRGGAPQPTTTSL